jgi:hypothetical protein
MSDKIVDSKLLLARDYSSLMEWSIDTIPKITKDWTDLSITSPETIWLSAACYSYDVLNYVLDRKFLNNNIRYSRSMSNLINMCILNGLEVSGSNSSNVFLNIHYNPNNKNMGSYINIVKGSYFNVFDVSNSRDLLLVSKNDYILNVGENIVECFEGESSYIELFLDDFTSRGTHVLDDKNIGHNTFEVSLLGNVWRRVSDAFLVVDSVPSYSVHIYKDGYTVLKLVPGFGDIIGGNKLGVSYVITNGSKGNIGISSKIEPKFEIINSLGNDAKEFIDIKVLRSGGGNDLPSVEDVRGLLGVTSSEVKTLTIENDYKDAVREVEYVYNCVVRDINNIKEIYYVADKSIGLYGISDVILRDRINEVLSKRVVAFTKYEIYPVLIRPLVISLRVLLSRNLMDVESLENRIRQRVLDIYDRKVIIPGVEFNRNSIIGVVEDLSSAISGVVVEYPTSDIYTIWNEIVEIDNISVVFERG